MADWSKLNAEFDYLINNLNNADWKKWESERPQKKTTKLKELLLKAKVQEEKISN